MFICSHKISCNILLHLLPSLFICATLHLHQISGTIFSLCFNAYGNPQPGFHFWISFAFFSKEFTQIFDEVTRSPQLSVIPGTGIATVSPGKWYGTSECNYIFSSYALFALSFYTQNVKIYSDSFHVRFVQRGDLWKQTTRQLQMGYTMLTQKTTLLRLYSETRYFVLSS